MAKAPEHPSSGTCAWHNRLQEQVDAHTERLGAGDNFLARFDERLKMMERLVYWMAATTAGAVIVTVVNVVLSLGRNGGLR